MLIDFLFPNRCLECNTIIASEKIICASCEDKVNFYHFNNQEDDPVSTRMRLLFPVEKTAALLIFDEEGLSRKVIHSLKYNKMEKTGKCLAEWTLEKIDKDFFSDIQYLATVPLHPKKLRERGYNQLHLYADCLSKKLQIPVLHNALERTKYKKAQALGNKESRASTDKIFKIKNALPPKHYLLIDDVLTTGNTIANIAWEILKNPGTKVSILVMAVDF